MSVTQLWQRPRRPLLSRFRAEDIFTDGQGSSCLLWTSHGDGAHGWTDSASREERLEHCRLAVLHGGAEGLLVYGDTAAVDPEIVLALRVVKRGPDYWAKWGCVTRTIGSRAPEASTAYLRRAFG